MQNALEPVAIADARAFLSLNIHDTAEDALLEMLIAGARAQAETYLRRHIAQQEVRMIYSSRPEIQLSDRVAVLQEVSYIDHETSTYVDLLPDTTQVEDRDGTILIIPCVRGENLHIAYINEEYCPPQIKNAILMMVRNSYTERGSDPLTDDVKRILAPHRVVRI